MGTQAHSIFWRTALIPDSEPVIAPPMFEMALLTRTEWSRREIGNFSIYFEFSDQATQDQQGRASVQGLADHSALVDVYGAVPPKVFDNTMKGL